MLFPLTKASPRVGSVSPGKMKKKTLKFMIEEHYIQGVKRVNGVRKAELAYVLVLPIDLSESSDLHT